MNLKEIKHRIYSVKNTQKITSAMKLVSAAKLRRTQSAIEGMRPYKDKLDSMLCGLLSSVRNLDTPYTVERDVRKVAVIAVASDSNMCGAFNANILRFTRGVIDEYLAKGVEVELYPVGEKMREAMAKYDMPVCADIISEAGAPGYASVAPVALSLMEGFAKGDFDRIELVYTRYFSASKLQPLRETFLPVDVSCGGGKVLACDYILEPGREKLLHEILPKVISLRLYTALLDSAVAEHSARMIAMQVATENADELIAELTLEYNKGRQQAITNELLDIISGSFM